ncbi:30S ribosomal protein S17 [Candidatus Wolfebacteria bacterium]|nr:30S ribosomal protein S17 [Candidatus Wolfebacteria bacterium]
MVEKNLQPNTGKVTKTLRGTVVSDKMQGTIVVLVEDYVKHPTYGKYTKRQKRYAVDNPNGSYKIGDTVTIESCRPLSKTKSFRIVP